MRSISVLMIKRFQTNNKFFVGFTLLALIVISSVLTMGVFIHTAVSQTATPSTNATNLMSNQTGSSTLLTSVVNISRAAGDEARSTATEYIFNATRGNNSGIATNVTTINNTQANQ